MKEFPIPVVLGKGQKPDSRFRLASSGFSETVKNFRPTGDGYEYNHALSHTITGATTTVSWPYPQLFKGEETGTTVLALSTALYTLNVSTWVATAVSTKDPADFLSSKAISSGGPWQFVSFQEYYYLTNGTTSVVSMPGQGGVALSVTDQTVQAVGRHGTRLLVGGLGGTYYTDSNSYFNSYIVPAWRRRASDEVVTHDSQTFDTNWIVWTAPSGGDLDLPWGTLVQQLAYPSHANVVKIRDTVLYQFENGILGMMPLKGGTVRTIQDYGNFVLVGTDRFIVRLDPTDTGYRESVLWPVGVKGRGWVTEGLIVDSNGILLEVSNGALQKVGYETELSALSSSIGTIVTNPTEGEFYIADGTTSYVYNEHGLAQSTNFITSLYEQNIGIASNPSNRNDFDWVSLPFDLNFNGQKTLNFVELRGFGLSSLVMYVYYRNDRTSSFTASSAIYGSPDGAFWAGQTGIEFKIRFTGTIASGGKLEEIIVRANYHDNPTVRGPRGTGLGALQSSSDS